MADWVDSVYGNWFNAGDLVCIDPKTRRYVPARSLPEYERSPVGVFQPNECGQPWGPGTIAIPVLGGGVVTVGEASLHVPGPVGTALWMSPAGHMQIRHPTKGVVISVGVKVNEDRIAVDIQSYGA
jgi:hypothetical protein